MRTSHRDRHRVSTSPTRKALRRKNDQPPSHGRAPAVNPEIAGMKDARTPACQLFGIFNTESRHESGGSATVIRRMSTSQKPGKVGFSGPGFQHASLKFHMNTEGPCIVHDLQNPKARLLPWHSQYQPSRSLTQHSRSWTRGWTRRGGGRGAAAPLLMVSGCRANCSM